MHLREITGKWSHDHHTRCDINVCDIMLSCDVHTCDITLFCDRDTAFLLYPCRGCDIRFLCIVTGCDVVCLCNETNRQTKRSDTARPTATLIPNPNAEYPRWRCALERAPCTERPNHTVLRVARRVAR
jgi:hypothetical protein